MAISNLPITFSEQNQRILNVRGDENGEGPEHTAEQRKQAHKAACSKHAARHRGARPFPESAGGAIFALQTCGSSKLCRFLRSRGQLRAKAAPHSLMWCRFVFDIVHRLESHPVFNLQAPRRPLTMNGGKQPAIPAPHSSLCAWKRLRFIVFKEETQTPFSRIPIRFATQNDHLGGKLMQQKNGVRKNYILDTNVLL
ncbi:MAG: hypothetical protein ACLUDH_16160, partial [Faecalispora sporosphaeroides]|uniref:hypothetical protein n=1 Tax=Faecalispora sporosphaeroides TaxID=1549 RepID=UPI0039962F0F